MDAGQTVPHVHVHVIPRKKRDFAKNDEIYEHLEHSEHNLDPPPSHAFPNIEDKDRIPRTEEEMVREAAWLAKLFES